MTPEEWARTNTCAQIRLSAGANIHIATLGWVDPRQEVSVTPEERAEEAFEGFSGGYEGEPSLAITFIVAAIRAAVAEAREEAIRNHRERLREWLVAHGVQPVNGESMLETGWRAARAMERQACLLDVWEGDISHPAAIEARIRARGQA